MPSHHSRRLRKQLKDPGRYSQKHSSRKSRQNFEEDFEKLTIHDGYSTPRTSQRAKSIDVPRQPQYLKVTVQASFDFYTSHTTMYGSYMASSSRHGKNKAPIEENSAPTSKMDVHATGWTIRANAVIGGFTINCLVDTASSYLLVNRNAVHSAYLENIPEEMDKQIALHFPFMDVKNVTGHLYRSTVCVGSHNTVQVEGQDFYVVDQLFDTGVLGIGPPTNIALINHSMDYAPSLLQNAVAQHSLRGPIYGFNFSSWVRPGGTDEIDFGGIDKNSYAGNMHYVERCRGAELDTWYSFKAITITCGSLSTASSYIGIFDTGSPAILLPEYVFYHIYMKNIADRNIECIWGVEGYKFPWMITISAESMENLGTLIFEFKDMKNGRPFSVKIPPRGQVFPLNVGTEMGVPPDRRALAVSICGTQPYNINLGFPFFQEYYTVADMHNEPHRIGFAKKTTTPDSDAPASSQYCRILPKHQEQGEGSHRDNRYH